VLSEDFPAQLAGFRAGSLLAGYRLQAQVGAGGMAVVWRARDERLGRLVALKILAPALALDSEFRRRFIAESRAAAAVDDPYIIPVYEAGQAEGVLFIAMRFVQGGDLRRILAREGALRPDRVVGFIVPVASALDAAHRAGLVHRDVKSANILVDVQEDRPDHVYLSDFGIVKGAGLPAGLTGTKQFIGTPAYAAPEQIRGLAVDGRTDQYALACVTYELLTGVLPFEPGQGMQVLLAHLSQPAPSVVSRMPGLPGAADQVLARAMAKAPEQRYASCLDFADALREALGLTPYDPRSPATTPAVPQPPATSPSKLPSRAAATRATPAKDTVLKVDQRGQDRRRTVTAWIRRHRLPALALACAILAAAGVIPFVLNSPAKSPGPTNSPSRASSPRPANSPSYSHAGIELPYAGSDVVSLAFSPSGTTLAIDSQYICFWDIAATGCTTPSVFRNENSVAFSPDGKTLAAGNATGRTALWNVAAGKLAVTLADPGSKGVGSVAFSPDGKLLAAGDFNGRTYLWDVAAGKLAVTVTDPGSKGVGSVAFSPDGKLLAAGDFNGRTYLWDVAAGKLAVTLTDPGSKGVDSVAFSPDGKLLAAGDFDGRTYLWDVAAGEPAVTVTDPGSKGVGSVAFSPDGRTLAASDGNGSTYLWNAATGKLIAALTDPGSPAINSVAFSPDGKTLATGDESGSVNLWHITPLTAQ
jgi:serine/threonine protein kinase